MFNELPDRVADIVATDPDNRLFEKCTNEELARLGFRNPTRTQIEKRVGIEVSDSCAMRTFHIISKNFEFRFQIRFGALANQKGLCRLTAVRSVGTFVHADFALVEGARMSARNIFEQLRARGVASDMFD